MTLRRIATGTPVEAGQLVVLDPGAFHRGYEGGIGRTRVGVAAHRHGRPALARGPMPRGRRRRRRLPGRRHGGRPDRGLGRVGGAPRAAGARVGLGAEPPVVGAGMGAAAVLAPGTVLAVTGWVGEEGVGGVLRRDLVHVTGGDPQG